ncbi:hypothetical protein E5K00_21690 [Hymenobacter aquaticus]|uniref:Uncharacterized protein n=1 Tax=Hymenobacter aquaticus TaxID=1867101 RepID=A0A4Z0PSA6_9BACT|nr:hypothetical protein [Hymenobacter aquaticus]TGE20610.1 hypothetical protein E5K00_21690 [Hymenobacter aquaticus]
MLLLLGWLATSCSSDLNSDPNPYLDLVGSARYVSTNRTIGTPGDTLTSKVYAAIANLAGSDSLQRLRITVTYSPQKNPLSYPAGYDPRSVEGQQEELVYLDTALRAKPPLKELAFQFTYGTRTTSGRELWRFEIEDSQQRTASRSYRLTLRNSDSALVYHRYAVRLQRANTAASRSYLALLPGLTLPKFTVRTNPAAQQLIDLIYLPTAAGVVLASPASPEAKPYLGSTSTWATANRRTTQLRFVSRSDSTGFGSATSAASFQAIFGRAPVPADPSSTGLLKKNQLVAFLTADNKYGLLLVQDVKTTPVPTLNLQVRIAK